MTTAPWSAGTEPARATLPEGSVDCHHHIYDTRFAYHPEADYRPPDATVAHYRQLRARLGTARSVIVQPSSYGVDNACLCDALASMGDSARGVAVIDAGTSRETLRALDASGVRGIRFNLARPAGAGVEQLELLAGRVADLGWHVQVHALGRDYPALETRLAGLPTPLVIDHLGRIPQPDARAHPAWAALRRLVDKGRTWIKLSGVDHDSVDGAPTYVDGGDLVRGWIGAAPQRVVWGTDWPHVSAIMNPDKSLPDDASILDLFHGWMATPEQRQAIFVDNPCELYGFEPPAQSRAGAG
ncbi:amidohydrolase family protein [Bordetella sp. H567]|uniref:amidohydrolase family protein n=1 Tax=Bordetella sp. H567 TaxID=1697043 RepID=UPI0009F6B15A|nr:amidohydrolase family protein [Bordetella sp. H567]